MSPADTLPALMTTPTQHLPLRLVLGVSLVLALGLALAARAGAAPVGTVDARVSAPFVMSGRIVTAVRVRGEHRGQAITRQWTFTGRSCAGAVCRQLSLRRERSAHQFDSLVLSRVGVGRYAGSGRFYAGLQCRGKINPRGLVVPYRVAVDVIGAVAIQGIRFASRLSATYTNPGRTDRTRCPIGPSHDAAQYSGVAAPLPSPPTAAFGVTVNGSADSATFTDTSTLGAGAAPIVSRLWQFGDPASGSANTAQTPTASHTFSAPGTYSVSLTVTDANGLTSSQTQSVVAPGPPTASFTESRSGTTLTYAFRDTSTPGVGTAPIVAWLWNFGDSSSGSADQSGAENPQHTFSGPGPYNVCLIITDANGRSATSCAGVVVPPPGAQAGQPQRRSFPTATIRQPSKRTVASTADSSPMS
jgi:PKD repeat protein